jgi:hypothetical protein
VYKIYPIKSVYCQGISGYKSVTVNFNYKNPAVKGITSKAALYKLLSLAVDALDSANKEQVTQHTNAFWDAYTEEASNALMG